MRGSGSYRMFSIKKLTPCRHSHSSLSAPRSRRPFRQCVPFFLSTFALRSPRSSFCGSGRGNQRKRRVAFTGNGDDATGCRFGGNVGGVLQRLGEMSRERKQRRQAAAMDNFRISFVSRKPKPVVKVFRPLRLRSATQVKYCVQT